MSCENFERSIEIAVIFLDDRSDTVQTVSGTFLTTESFVQRRLRVHSPGRGSEENKKKKKEDEAGGGKQEN